MSCTYLMGIPPIRTINVAHLTTKGKTFNFFSYDAFWVALQNGLNLWSGYKTATFKTATVTKRRKNNIIQIGPIQKKSSFKKS